MSKYNFCGGNHGICECFHRWNKHHVGKPMPPEVKATMPKAMIAVLALCALDCAQNTSDFGVDSYNIGNFNIFDYDSLEF